MAMTNAERQANYRRRQREEREALRRAADNALRAENERLRGELAKFSHPCGAHQQAAEHIRQCPRCGQESR
jgi:hypothetical protein